MRKTVLDRTKVKVAAARADKSLRQINDEAGLSNAYIYTCFGTNKIQLATVDAIANALGCRSVDLLSEIGDDPDTHEHAPTGVTESHLVPA